MRARNEENMAVVDGMVLIQEDKPQITRPTAQSAVIRIIFTTILALEILKI